MKRLAALLFPFLIVVMAHCQVITYENFKEVIPFMQKQDFKAAFEHTGKLLGSTQNDSSDFRGIVTYMNILSAAGMVSLGQMTHDAFKKNAQQYIGQTLVMSAHPCIDSAANGSNSLKFVMRDGSLQGETITLNARHTSILCFEYYTFANRPDVAGFIGKMVRMGGRLESIEVNPNHSIIWISRLHIADAFARVVE